MCRLTAYCGPAIPLENIVISPRHSLLCQSQQANEAKIAHNGDGFGLAWYKPGEMPGLYRDVLPAWADTNLLDICRMVESPLFMAHVRAATGSATSRENCHPFMHGKWTFMHNGQISNFSAIRRELEAELPDALYDARTGSTDSELFFLLALSFGLDNDAQTACERALHRLLTCQRKYADPVSTRIACIFSDGDRLFGIRYSSDRIVPTLYHSNALTHGGFALASEPLDAATANWEAIPAGSFFQYQNGRLTTSRLNIPVPLAA